MAVERRVRAAGLAQFNALPAGEARRALLACCASARWAAEVMEGRPYTCAGEVLERSDESVDGLAVADLVEALSGHPRIGERAGPRAEVAGGPAAGGPAVGGPAAGGPADWSRREQAGMDSCDAATARALAEGNLAYERRFDHIYLVCATGRSGSALLALLRSRLGNDDETEWGIVRAELGKINHIRLRKLLGAEGGA